MSAALDFTSQGTSLSCSYFLQRFNLPLEKIFTEEFVDSQNAGQLPRIDHFKLPLCALDCKCTRSAGGHFGFHNNNIISFMDLVREVAVTPAQVQYAKLYFNNLLTRMRKKFKATTIVGGPDGGKDLAIHEDLVVDSETGVLARTPCAPRIGACHFSRDVPALAVRATLRELKAEVGDKLRVPISYLLELTGACGYNWSCAHHIFM